MMESCRWIYRPGTNNSCLAVATCDHVMRYLSRINPMDNESIGCADWYNGKLCPGCSRIIQMDYTLIKIVKITLDELNAELTAEELRELKTAEGTSPVFDEDSPPMANEQLMQFKRQKQK